MFLRPEKIFSLDSTVPDNWYTLRYFYNVYIFLQLEADLRVAQAEFDRQYEVTKLLLDGVTTAQVQ